MKKVLVIFSLFMYSVSINAQNNTNIEIQNNNVNISATNNVNILTNTGNAYYNGNEIVTKKDLEALSIYPESRLITHHLDLKTVERIVGNGYLDFLVYKGASVSSGYQWWFTVETHMAMANSTIYRFYDGKLSSMNHYMGSYICYKTPISSDFSLIYDISNNKLYLRLHNATSDMVITSQRIVISYLTWEMN